MLTITVVTLNLTILHVNISIMKPAEAPETVGKKPTLPTAAKPRAYRGLGLQERTAERRARLLAAGIQVIGLHGYAGATVKAVCAEAQLTERYFYESFDNGEALLLACYEQLIGTLQQQVEAALLAPATTPAQRAEAGLVAYFKYLHQPAVARILLLEVLGVSSAVDARYRAAMDVFAGVVQGLAEPMLRRSALPVDLQLLAHGLIGSVIHMALQWYLGGYRQSETRVVATALALINALQRHAEDDRR
jgi:AcrR family transcriptional regulator